MREPPPIPEGKEEYIVLPPRAQDKEGFRAAINLASTEPYNAILGGGELWECRCLAYAAGGGTIVRCRQPLPPESPGGQQVWGEFIDDLNKLDWQCVVEVVIPGCTGTELWAEGGANVADEFQIASGFDRSRRLPGESQREYDLRCQRDAIPEGDRRGPSCNDQAAESAARVAGWGMIERLEGGKA